MNTIHLETSVIKKFHKKYQMNNTHNTNLNLDQAIKKNTIKHFIKKGLRIETEGQLIEGENYQDLKGHLLRLKKQCNQLDREIKSKQRSTTKLKEGTLFNNEKTQKIHEEQQKLEEKIAELEKNLEKISLKREAAEHSSKTYEHILQRMKIDSVHHQLYKNGLKRKLKTLQKSFNITQTKHYNITEFEKQAEAGLKDANIQLQQQNYQRQLNYTSIDIETKIKIQRQNKLKQRQKQTQLIQQLAADDILDADLIKLKKFLTVQIFIRQLLKSKILKLKKYFSSYQHSFFIIKFHTNVKDATSLKYQFSNFENLYNEKIRWVKHLQNEIVTYERQKKRLQQKLMDIKITQMENIQKVSHKNEQQQNKSILSKKSLQYLLIWEKIQPWIIIQMKKLKLENINNANANMITMFKQIIHKFKQTNCQILGQTIIH